MFRSQIAVTFVCAVVAIPAFADAGGPNAGCRSCNSALGAPITGGVIFGGHHPHDQPIGTPITGGVIFGGHHPHDQPIGTPITGGVIFGGHHPHDQPIGTPITGGVIFGGHHAGAYSTPILERPNRPFHFYGNAARRTHNNSSSN